MRPLTRSQELIWAGQSLAGDAPLYNQAWRIDLTGDLDPNAFADAFDALVQSYDALRLVVAETPDGPRQSILPTPPKALDRLAPLDDVAAATFLRERADRPFNLSTSTYDAALLPLTADAMAAPRWIWFLNQHHIATDAWSASVFLKAMDHLYRARRRGEPLALSPPTFLEQAAALAPIDDPARSKRWADTAATAPGPAALYGVSSGATNAQTTKSVRLKRRLGADRAERLATTAALKGVRGLSAAMTRFNLMATALFAWQARVSGQRDLSIGATTNGRETGTARETAGLFIEVFPLIASLDDGETFRSLYRKVSQSSIELLRDARPGASTAATAKSFAVVLNVIHATMPRMTGFDTRVDWIEPGAIETTHDVQVHVYDVDGDGDPTIALDMKADVFPEAIRDRALDHFFAVLDAMLNDIDQTIDTVAIATPHEVRHQLTVYNAAEAPLSEKTTVMAMIDAQAAATPNAVAIRDGDQSIDFATLTRWSSAIAATLVSRGLKSGDVVGVQTRRSADSIAAALAVMKAGGVYTPLEPGLPEDRRRYIIDDAQISIVLSDAGLLEGLAGLDVDAVAIPDPAATAPTTALSTVDATSPAYVLYTSGSTGAPKGVVVSHDGFARYIAWSRAVYADNAPVSMPLCTSLGFDLTLTSMFLPLATGGTVVVYPDPDDGGPDDAVRAAIAEDQVDVVKLTPAHLSLVVAEKPLSSGDAPASAGRTGRRLRALIVGGENLTTSLALKAQSILGAHIAILNEYGPTEAIVGCMLHRFDPARDREGSVPIGAPASGSRIYLLDEGRNPVPIGAPGEMYIGGERLALGYLGRDDLTAEKFVVDPFVKGGRAYRTGDLARMNETGALEFLGRADRQLKIRGVRIEPAEIELVLQSAPGVDEVVVGVENGERLVAYLVGAIERGEIRQTLQKRLPLAMTPTRIVSIDRIPLTTNGKIDRSALPASTPADALPSNAAFRPPTTELETVIADVWRDVLAVEAVGVDDNYYDIGGDSMAAIQIAARLKRRGVDAPAVLAFRHQTVAETAAAVERRSQQTNAAVSAPRDETSSLALDSKALNAIKAALGGGANRSK